MSLRIRVNHDLLAPDGYPSVGLLVTRVGVALRVDVVLDFDKFGIRIQAERGRQRAGVGALDDPLRGSRARESQRASVNEFVVAARNTN